MDPRVFRLQPVRQTPVVYLSADVRAGPKDDVEVFFNGQTNEFSDVSDSVKVINTVFGIMERPLDVTGKFYKVQSLFKWKPFHYSHIDSVEPSSAHPSQIRLPGLGSSAKVVKRSGNVSVRYAVLEKHIVVIVHRKCAHLERNRKYEHLFNVVELVLIRLAALVAGNLRKSCTDNSKQKTFSLSETKTFSAATETTSLLARGSSSRR